MARKLKKRRPKTQRRKTWDACSLYIRLRDAVEYQKKHPDTPFGYVKCCTCPRIVIYNKNADAGHCISRGSRGGSGVYFDERNINTQCKPCNGFEGGRVEIHKAFIVEKYGQIMDELEFLDANHIYRPYDLIGLELFYKQKYEELLR